MKRPRKLAIAGVTGAMLVGAGTGVVLNLPSSAGASNAPARSAIAVTDPPTTPTTEAGAPAATTAPADSGTATAIDDDSGTAGDTGKADFLKTALDKLVAAGTITQAQEDAIIAGLTADRPAPGADGAGPAGPMGDHGHGGAGGRDGAGPGFDGPGFDGPGFGGPGFGGPGFGGRGLGMGLDTAATALGITTDELKTDLQAGKTVADVAKGKGVDVQKVIDALVAAETANITQRVTDAVNGVKPTPPADAPDATATTTPTTDTTGS